MGTLIKAEAFISIEETTARTLDANWVKAAEALTSEVTKLVEAGRFNDAHALADSFRLPALGDNHLGKIEELAVSAMLFGAHHAAGDLAAVKLGRDGPPPQVSQALAQLKHLVDHDTPDLIRDRLHEVIAAAEDATHWSKEDLAGEDLDRDGGKLNPEQGPTVKRKKPLAKADQTLYVNRPLLNAGELIYWAKSNGFSTTLVPEDLHVTIAFSKKPVDWNAFTPRWDSILVFGGERSLVRFGDAVVLRFEDETLTARWKEFCDGGCSWDFDDYRPHVTISWQAADVDLQSIAPFDGELVFGIEEFEPIEENWRDTIVEKAEKVEKTLADQLNDAVMGTGRMMMDIGANVTTSRLVSFGFLAEAVDVGIDRYEVNEVLDARTCQLCRFMHGKQFDVKREHARVLTALGTTDPNELRSIAPWPSASKANLQRLRGQSDAELQASGIGSPPFHPGCRGFMVPAGTTEQVVEPAPQQPGVIDLLRDPTRVAYEALASKVNDHVKLTPGETAALDEYVGNLHSILNRVLRRGTKDAETKAYLAPKKRMLDQAVAKGKIPAWTTVYRGVQQPLEVFGGTVLDDAVGSVFLDKGFMSVTTDFARAASYGEGGAVFEIKVPPGLHAIAPDLVPGVMTSAEYELLLKRGLKLYVTAITQESGVTVIHATVVSPIGKAEEEATGTADLSPRTVDNRFVYQPGDLQRL